MIDTNIFIFRENDKVLPEILQRLLRILSKLKVEILVHPESINELKRDQDENRKKVALSKAQTYQTLENPPDQENDKDFLDIVRHPKNINDKIDNAILFSIYRNAVGFLVTEDKGVHKKASRLNIDNRVLSIEDAVNIFEKSLPTEEISHPLAIKKVPVYNLNIEDPFFDSLKAEYDFEKWFEKICQDGREAWVHHRKDGSIGALLIYNIENEPIDCIPPLPKERRLKLCTFKSELSGNKIGELFIKLSIKYAIKNDLAELYLTHYTKEEDILDYLITEYGFERVAKKTDREEVYLKKLFPSSEEIQSLTPMQISKKFYPSFHDGEVVKKFIVPIRPEYHDRLFVGDGKRQAKLFEFNGKFIVEGNTIKKAYLCNSRAKEVSPGDILIFYRSQDERGLTLMGVVEEAFPQLQDEGEINRIVGKRTVYSMSEIESIAKKPTLVILFTSHFRLKNPLKLEELEKMGVLKMAPQSIMQISHEKYQMIKKAGGLDERFTVN